MDLLLDTHILIWWVDEPEKLPGHLYAVLEDSANDLFISIASVWEMQIKHQLGKLQFQQPLPQLIANQQQHNGARLISVTLSHVFELNNLPLHHKDPFDRLLVAQAIVEDMTLVSVDPAFALYSVKLLS